LFLPSVRFLPPSSIRDFRFFAGTERACRLQASSLAAPSQDLLDSGMLLLALMISDDASTMSVTDFAIDSSGPWHWGPGCSPDLHRRLRFFLFFRLRHLNLSLPSFSWDSVGGQMSTWR